MIRMDDFTGTEFTEINESILIDEEIKKIKSYQIDNGVVVNVKYED